MGQRYGEEFKREAVRLALMSGLSRKQISTDLGMGFSTLNKWVQPSRDEDLLKGPQVDRRRSFPGFARRTEFRAKRNAPSRGRCRCRVQTRDPRLGAAKVDTGRTL